MRVTIDGSDVDPLLVGGVQITRGYNERWTAELTLEGYVPPQRAEVFIYEPDNVTVMFGGIVMDVSVREAGQMEGALVVRVSCVDWWVYFDWRLVNGGYGLATVSLLQVLTDLVDLYMAAYGITLDPAQEVGPTGSSPGLNWAAKWASDVVRDLSRLSGGWIASVSPAKVLRMVKPSLLVPSAPYALTDAASHCLGLTWDRDSTDYANRIVMRCGGDKTQEVTQIITVTSGHVSDGYIDIYAPSTPTGGVSATIDRGSGPTGVTIGGPGAQLIWTWNGGSNAVGQAVPRITVGSISPIPAPGDVIAVTFTAQMPFYYVREAGPTPYLDVFYDFEDITGLPAAESMAAGLEARHFQEPQEFTIPTVDAGFAPGQVLTINLTKYQVNTTAMITQVTSVYNEHGVLVHTLRALAGIYRGSPLDFFRGLGGRGSTGGGSTFFGGVNPAVVTTVIQLGGATDQTRTPTAGTYVKVVNAPPFVAPANMDAVVWVDLWARNAGVQVTARLRDLTAGTTAGTSSGVTSQTPQRTPFTATLVEGHAYELQVTSDTSGEGVYAIGSLNSV